MSIKNGTQKNNEIIEIQLLGDFSLTFNGKTLNGRQVRSKRVWDLLQYIIVNRHKEVSMDKLIQVLWPEDELEDPANALKNLAYRLRNLLKDTFQLDGKYLIIYKQGAYIWNPDIPCTVDIDILEEAFKETRQNNLTEEELLDRYEIIIHTYKGNFLPHASYKEWVTPLVAYYQRLYMSAVAKLCELRIDRGEYKQVEEVARQGIVMDPFVEENHVYLLKALTAINKQEKAVNHYHYIWELFYRELGVRPSEMITSIYNQLMDQEKMFQKSILAVQKDLRESEEIRGAVYCNYEMFKRIYQLESRAAIRSGKSIFLTMLTLADPDGINTQAEEEDLSLTELEEIKEIIRLSLRKDDVITRLGKRQFLILLSNISYENCNMVLDKLKKRIVLKTVSKDIQIHQQIQPLQSVELEVMNGIV